MQESRTRALWSRVQLFADLATTAHLLHMPRLLKQSSINILTGQLLT